MPSLGLSLSLPTVPILNGPIDPQTCVDVAAQPNISTFDFTGLTGLDFVTGGTGLYLQLFNGSGLFYPWYNTGTETDPGLSGTGLQISCFAYDPASSLASEMASAVNLYVGGTFSASASGNVCTITTLANIVCTPSNAGTSGVAVSTTQSGQPNGHYCSPTSDALSGISFDSRFQATYLGVGYNASLSGAPAYTTKDLNGNQLLFQDTAMTVPAVNADDTVAAWYDPTTGLSAIQTNSMLCPTLQFSQNSLGIWVPYLDCSASGVGMLTNATVNLPFIITIGSLQLGSGEHTRIVQSGTINALISPTRVSDSWYLNGDVRISFSGQPANTWSTASLSAIDGQNPKAWLNGVNITNSVTAAVNWGPLAIGAAGAIYEEGADGNIASVMVYDPSNRATVEAYCVTLNPLNP